MKLKKLLKESNLESNIVALEAIKLANEEIKQWTEFKKMAEKRLKIPKGKKPSIG